MEMRAPGMVTYIRWVLNDPQTWFGPLGNVTEKFVVLFQTFGHGLQTVPMGQCWHHQQNV